MRVIVLGTALVAAALGAAPARAGGQVGVTAGPVVPYYFPSPSYIPPAPTPAPNPPGAAAPPPVAAPLPPLVLYAAPPVIVPLARPSERR